MPRMPAVIVLVSLVASATGCSQDPLGRQAISGTVKVDGAPLAKGSINFEPVEGQPTAGGSPISDGQYEVPREGGLMAGKYRVSINAPVPGTGGQVDENALPGDPPAPPKELIPRAWNTASEQTIQVQKQRKNVFDFEVSTKAPASAAKSKP